MLVCYLLKNPIVATYIRIIPLAWKGHIALRAGFYGCKSGKQFKLSVPKLKIFNKYCYTSQLKDVSDWRRTCYVSRVKT